MEFVRLFLNVFFRLFEILILARIIFSWLPLPMPAGVARFIMETTEPYLRFFRSFIPPIAMIDISPIVAILALGFIEMGVFRLLSMV